MHEDMLGYSSKFSPRMKLFLRELKAEENPDITIIIRTINDLKEERMSQLKAIGAEIHTIAGEIVTLSLPVKALSILAKKDFVGFIELTRPLYPE